MKFVYEAYDDKTADIMDTDTGCIDFYTEKNLISLAAKQKVIGLETKSGKISSLESYNWLQFPSNEEAREYKQGLRSVKEVHFETPYGVAMFIAKGIVRHVDYYVLYCLGNENHFVSAYDSRTTTPYLESAKEYTKRDAQNEAHMRTRNSKTGKFWTTLRVPLM